jgi:hypothetical protein
MANGPRIGQQRVRVRAADPRGPLRDEPLRPEDGGDGA